MKFTSFVHLVTKTLQQQFGEDYQIFSQKITKNNGIELTGITAQKKNVNLFPTIYINEYYREDMTEEQCEQIIQEIYDRIRNAERITSVDMTGFFEYAKAKKRIGYKLINTEKNQELLKEIPHREFFNLSMVYFYLVPENQFDTDATILIKNNQMKAWQKKEEDLYQAAYQNMPELFPSKIDSMAELLKDFYQEDVIDDTVFMFVLTNSQKMFGAASMLYPEELKSFARLQESNLYLLPSSIHEIIIIPERPEIDKKLLLKIVMEVNRTQVAEEEVLADSVYFYNKKEEALYLLDIF